MTGGADSSPVKCRCALAICLTTRDILSRGIASSRQAGHTDAFHCQWDRADERVGTP